MAEGNVSLLRGNKASYDAINPDNDTLYFVLDQGELYLGSNRIANFVLGLPEVTAADDGKMLQVVNGSWAAVDVNISTVYTGSGDPLQTLGNDGDIYLDLG